MRSKYLLITALVLLIPLGCKSTDKYWSFPLISSGTILIPSFGKDCIKGDGEAALLMIPLVLTSPIWGPILSLGVDLALLPITIPHDLYLMHLKRKKRKPRPWGVTGDQPDLGEDRK